MAATVIGFGIAAVVTAGAGTALYNSVGSSPETLPVGCASVVEVEKYDSWSGVASKYGMSAQELAVMNDTTIEEVPHPGDLLCTALGGPVVSDTVSAADSGIAFVRDGSTCSPNTEIYTIKAGEGPYSAAEYFGFPLSTVYDMNPGLKEATVYTGDVICSIIDVGELDADSELSDAQTTDNPSKSAETVSDSCMISADVNGDGDTVTDDYDDVLAFQKQYNNTTGLDITEDGNRGQETNGAIKDLQEVVGTKVDCDWGKASKDAYEAYQQNTVKVTSSRDQDGVRNGCEPYHDATEIVLCASLGDGDEPLELYQRGEDGNMHLVSSAYGRSSRYDADGPEGNDDCITPRNHVKLDKSAMQRQSSKELEFFIPFDDCGGGEGTAIHYYPHLSSNDDSHGCVRAPYNFIENAYYLIENGGQTEVIVRDK